MDRDIDIIIIEQDTPSRTFGSHLLNPLLMESQVKCHSAQNISEVSQQNRTTPLLYTTEVVGLTEIIDELKKNVLTLFSSSCAVQVYRNSNILHSKDWVSPDELNGVCLGECCNTVLLQKCFVDFEALANFPPTGG